MLSGQPLAERFRQADDAAAREAFELYAERLRTLAQRHLHRRIRQKVDADDIVQSAYRSFFTRARRGDWDLVGWNEVWALLTTITLRKCLNRVDHYLAARRDVRREVALATNDSIHAASPLVTENRQPSPDEAAMLAESVQQLIARVAVRDREIVAAHLQGYSVAEISLRQGRAERTVRRVLARVRDELQSLANHD